MEHTYPQTFSGFTDNKSYTRKVDIDIFLDYVIPVPCQDCVSFFMPFTSTDVFHYQFNDQIQAVQFFNPTNDEEIITGAATISGKTFSIDFSQLTGIDCFYIKVNGDCRLQHGYTRAEVDCDRATVLLESFYSKNDFLGNDYTLNAYSNKVRVFAELEWKEEETETEEDSDGKVTLQKIRSVYELRFMEEIDNGSWMLSHILKSVLRGDGLQATYNGETYQFDRFTDGVAKDNDTSESWMPIIDLKTSWIEQDYKC